MRQKPPTPPAGIKKKLKILILEDVAADVVLINHELRQSGHSFVSKRVDTREEFLSELEHNTPDIILSDHGLPAFDGFTALATARDRKPSIPFIFVTGSKGEELAVDSLKSGADDYVLKSNLAALTPAVQRALRMSEERARREHAEHELRDSDERFRLLVEGVRDYAISMLDPEGRVASWNVGAKLLYGYIDDEVIGRHFELFYLPADRAAGKPAALLRTATNEGRVEEDGQRVRKGGGTFWANVVVSALRDSQGMLRGYAEIIRDVTTRHEAEEALYRSDIRFRELVGQYPDALFILNQDRIAHVNTAALQLIGCDDVQQLAGHAFAEFVDTSGLEDVDPPARESSGEGAHRPSRPSCFCDARLTRFDGNRIDVELATAPLVYDGESASLVIVRDISERKQAAAALLESQATITAILSTALDAIVRIDREGRVHEWNAAAERMFGVPAADAMGRQLDALVVPPPLRQRYLPGLMHYLTTGVGSLIGRPIELPVCRVNGVEFPVELAITRDPTGDPPMFTVFIHDITDRRRADEALRASEARKTAIMENALDAIVSIDASGKVVEWNPAAEKTFGYSRSLALGRDLGELIIPPAYIDAFREGLERHRATGRSRLIGKRIEKTALKANGAEFPVELAIIRSTGQVPLVFTAFIHDISARRRAEEALRKSEERFRLLVEGTEEYAIFMLDPHGRVTTWNAGAERIYGYRSSEIVGRRFTRFFTPEDTARGKPEQKLAVAKAEGRFAQERWNLRKDGSRFWAYGVMTALRDHDGRLYGFSEITHDITRRKQSEDEIRDLNTQLEQRVRERTSELEAAYHEAEAFSYSISHDLRAPLVQVSGFIDLLSSALGEKAGEKVRHYLDTIRDSSVQMGHMIDSLLELSRTGRAEMHRESIDLGEAVRNLVARLRTETTAERCEFEIGPLPVIQGDPTLIRQALYNLLSNAIKYSRNRDKPRIWVGSRQAGNETVVHVRDNGVGYDPAYGDKLFGVFQRLHSSTEFEGTGVGLANVRRIVQRHGGRTWAEGAPDQGATFYLSLPLPPSPDPSHDRP